MNEKNKKNTNVDVKHTAEDIQLYRLFCIFGAAILGFALFRMVPYNVFSRVLGIGQWVALGLLVLVIGGYLFVRLVRKPDESGRIVTSTGLAYFLIPVLLMLACYRTMSDPGFKCQVAFGFVALFAAIYNIFKQDFSRISAVTFLSIISLYYASTATYNWLENIFAVAAKIAIFLIPALMIAKILLDRRAKKDVSRFDMVLTLAMCAFLLACAVLVLIVPSIFLYAMITILVVYVIVGIVCTIRLI
ncbi:MAG: hypothetical protein IJV98_09145 [Clostridia bacterium]|nr:hypothetical protein [Clostridia bacterium]